MITNNPKLQELTDKLGLVGSKLNRYRVVIFLLFVVILYGFIAYRINTLTNSPPSSASVNNQVNAAQIPHLDPTVVKQLQSLQDNSVNVKTLFNQARNNPFQ